MKRIPACTADAVIMELDAGGPFDGRHVTLNAVPLRLDGTDCRRLP